MTRRILASYGRSMNPDNDPLRAFVETLLIATVVALVIAVLWAVLA